jgi:hypothetical protein
VATQSGIDFQHVNGASPDRHLYEIMSGGGLFSITTTTAGSTSSSLTADR